MSMPNSPGSLILGLLGSFIVIGIGFAFMVNAPNLFWSIVAGYFIAGIGYVMATAGTSQGPSVKGFFIVWAIGTVVVSVLLNH